MENGHRHPFLAWLMFQLVAVVPVAAYVFIAAEASLPWRLVVIATASFASYYAFTLAAAAMSLHQKLRRSDHGDNIMFFVVPGMAVLWVWWRLTVSSQVANPELTPGDFVALAVLVLSAPFLTVFHYRLYREGYLSDAQMLEDAERSASDRVNRPPPSTVHLSSGDVKIDDGDSE